LLKLVTTTSTSLTGLSALTAYYYAVAAVDNAGSVSALSPSVTVSTPACSTTTTVAASTTTTTLASGAVPPPPTGLSASPICGQVNLRWNASSGATAYQVYIWNGSTWVPLTRVTTTSASSTGLANSTTYYYDVAALNSAGQSAPTPWVSATTPACG